MTDRAFFDGNDLCAGCGRCCSRVEGMVLTREELDRVPLIEPYVTGVSEVVDGSVTKELLRVDMPDGCPYLDVEGRCSTFETRPFDCSLYPVIITSIQRRPTGDALLAWRYEGSDCPKRWEFISRAERDPAAFERVREFGRHVAGRDVVELEHRGRRKAMVQVWLHRLRIYPWLFAIMRRLWPGRYGDQPYGLDVGREWTPKR